MRTRYLVIVGSILVAALWGFLAGYGIGYRVGVDYAREHLIEIQKANQKRYTTALFGKECVNALDIFGEDDPDKRLWVYDNVKDGCYTYLLFEIDDRKHRTGN